MGQYYHAVVLPPTQQENAEIIVAFNPHHYFEGAKLTELSSTDSGFTSTVESLFLPGEKYHKHRLVWAGDYADPEAGSEDNLYYIAKEMLEKIRLRSVPAMFRYLVNHTKKLYMDKTTQKANQYGWAIHPLPLLTCEGNGRGGGDYFTDDENLLQHIGSWARDIISVEAEIPEGYTEIVVSF